MCKRHENGAADPRLRLSRKSPHALGVLLAGQTPPQVAVSFCWLLLASRLLQCSAIPLQRHPTTPLQLSLDAFLSVQFLILRCFPARMHLFYFKITGSALLVSIPHPMFCLNFYTFLSFQRTITGQFLKSLPDWLSCWIRTNCTKYIHA